MWLIPDAVRFKQDKKIVKPPKDGLAIFWLPALDDFRNWLSSDEIIFSQYCSAYLPTVEINLPARLISLKMAT